MPRCTQVPWDQGALTNGAIIEATPNMPPVRLWYVGRLSMGAMCAMMMKEPPVTPALPIPATARYNHRTDLALTAKSHGE